MRRSNAARTPPTSVLLHSTPPNKGAERRTEADHERKQHQREYWKAWRAGNSARQRYEAVYRAEKRERIRQNARNYKRRHVARIREQAKVWNERRREKRAASRRNQPERVRLTHEQLVDRNKARQREMRRSHAAKGLCAICARPRVLGKTKCADHLQRAAVRQREYTRRKRAAPVHHGCQAGKVTA